MENPLLMTHSRDPYQNLSAMRTVNLAHVQSETTGESNTELDTHADTCVIGGNAVILRDHERPVNVTGYDSQQGTNVFDTVDAALAYDDPRSGRVRILVVNQAIHIPQLQHNLLCPMQLRMNGLEVNDVPKFLSRNPSDRTHAITIPDDDEEVVIPLSLHGGTSYFPTRKPSRQELLEYGDDEIQLTYEAPIWDPKDDSFRVQEDEMTDHNGEVRTRPAPATQVLCPLSTNSTFDGRLDSFQNEFEAFQVASIRSKPKNRIDPQTLADRWGIGREAAKLTLAKTTQRGVRTVLHPSLSRRFRTNDRQLRYRRLPIDLYGDTLIASTKSKRGNTTAEIYCARNGWKRAFPMKAKAETPDTLRSLFANDGVPNTLIVDGSKEQTAGMFRQVAREAAWQIRVTEPYSPWQNAAEVAIRELKRGVGRKMVRTASPNVLWDHCLELEALIQSNTASNVYGMDGETPETIVSGETSDISQFCEHGWYDWVYFRDTAMPFPDDKMVLGRYLGPSRDIRPAMTAKLLKSNGQVLHRSTYRALTPEEKGSEVEKAKRADFDKLVRDALGAALKVEALPEEDAETPTNDLYADDDGETHRDATEEEPPTPEEGDQYINAEVLLPNGPDMVSATIRRRKRDADGQLKGTQHSNPILDTRVYEVEFLDGRRAEYAANVIAENMWAQSDLEGNRSLLLDEFIDYRKNGHALTDANRWTYVRGKRHKRRSTRGWELCVKWKDGSTSWERLANLKESLPAQVADYAVAQGIDAEPAFDWWVPYTIKKRAMIIAQVQTRYHKLTHKFGIRVPKSVAEARQIDMENGNTLWMDAIKLELANVRVAFEILDDDTKIPIGYQRIMGHFVFDVKMENFRRKARYVAGGHVTEAPKTLTYASVVSRETVRIALTVAALNGLEVKAGDVQNAYLTAPVSEKIWTVLGPEWGEHQGKRAIIVRALYGLKSSGASFRNHLADCMRTIGYKPCLADPDLWYKAEVRPHDGSSYYAYMLLYVDDCLAIHHDAMSALRELDRYFPMKPGSLGDPNVYLGTKLKETILPNGVKAWGMSPSKYVQEAVRNVEEQLARKHLSLPKKISTPFANDYHPERDVSKELGPEQANEFQSHIGILRWMVEIGRLDIIREISMLSSHLALPREGHLEAVYRIYGYLKLKHNSRMIFDPTYPEIDETTFQRCDWRQFYGDVKEAVPQNAQSALGKEVDLRLFVDSSHADDKVTRRSRTGYFIYMNMAPIAWISKKQATIETSVFGAEFVAMKLGMEALRGIQYKLRMMGVPISGPSYVYGDNMSVINNTSKPESVLKKKSNSICYHVIREAVAMGECITAHIPTNDNVADLATKVIPGGLKRRKFVGMLLYDLMDEH